MRQIGGTAGIDRVRLNRTNLYGLVRNASKQTFVILWLAPLWKPSLYSHKITL